MGVHQIDLQSPDTIESFRRNLESDPSNPNIINVIPNKRVLNEKFYLIESEQVVDYILKLPDNGQDRHQVQIGKNLVCVLDRNQLRRVYNFFNSFVTNFALLDSIFKLYISIVNDEKSLKIEKPKEEPVKLILETPVVTFQEDQKPDLAPKNEVEYILENYCISNIFRSFIIHHLFNYLRYCTSQVKIEKDKNVISIPILFDPFYYNLNYDHIMCILRTTFLATDDKIISFNQKKIIDTIQGKDSGSELEILLLIFIFYCYQFKTIQVNYPDFEFEYFFKQEIQQSILNYFIKQLGKEFVVNVFEESDENYNEELIISISEKYKHLIPVSETDFLSVVVNEYKKPREFKIKDFKISFNNILDLNSLMENNTIIEKVKNQDSPSVNTSLYSTRSCSSSLLNFESKIITKTYYYFKEYVNNPTTLSSLLLLKESPVPKQILNLFDFFSRNFQKLFKNGEDNKTLSYYKILSDHLPSPRSYDHQTYLYLIYNLIIPYHYDNFKITKFVDCFL
jgi:hypothetical protein